MDSITYLVILALICVIGYFGTKIYEIWSSKKRYRNSQAEFISDLYKMQQKWSSRGEYEYSEAMNRVINAFNLPQDIERAETVYGQSLQKKMVE